MKNKINLPELLWKQILGGVFFLAKTSFFVLGCKHVYLWYNVEHFNLKICLTKQLEKLQELQFLEGPLEPGCKTEAISIDLHAKMSKLTNTTAKHVYNLAQKWPKFITALQLVGFLVVLTRGFSKIFSCGHFDCQIW